MHAKIGMCGAKSSMINAHKTNNTLRLSVSPYRICMHSTVKSPLCVVQTHILVVDSHSFGADMFMCADMLVDTPVTPPTTADTPLASGREHSNVKKNMIAISERAVMTTIRLFHTTQRYITLTIQTKKIIIVTETYKNYYEFFQAIPMEISG